jgi:hypothetical protein
MQDDMGNVEELELLRAQRARLASRLKAPWWYIAGSAVALAVGCAMPIGAHYVRGTGIWCGVLAIVLLLLLQHALVRVSGVALGTGTWPSGRAWSIAVGVVILANSGVETFLLDRGLLAAAIVVGVLATLAGTGCLQGILRGIRRDLETGKGAM